MRYEQQQMFFSRPCEMLTLCLVASFAVPVTAQSVQPAPDPASEEIIMGAWSDPARCNAANAKRLSFEEVIDSGRALNGQCVAVEGFWAARALFSRAAYANRSKSNVAPALRHKRIGIYAREEVLEHAPRRAARYTVVGVVGQCETEWPDAMMVMGYCHYTGGPIIKVAQTIAGPLRKVR